MTPRLHLAPGPAAGTPASHLSTRAGCPQLRERRAPPLAKREDWRAGWGEDVQHPVRPQDATPRPTSPSPLGPRSIALASPAEADGACAEISTFRQASNFGNFWRCRPDGRRPLVKPVIARDARAAGAGAGRPG